MPIRLTSLAPGRRTRAALLGLGALALTLACASAAHAHGGPPLPTPPVKPPEPPKPGIPPMPPPPSTEPPRPLHPPPGSQPLGPAPGLPEVTPRKPSAPDDPPPEARPGEEPPPTSGRGRVLPGRRRSAPLAMHDETTWQTWWLLARAQWLPTRTEARRRAVLTPEQPLSPLEAPPSGARDGADLARGAFVERTALPLLLELAGSATRGEDLRASSLLALARVSTSEAARAHVLEAVRDARAPNLVRESAALALGLFRRSEPALQLPACDLELLREAALELFDDEQAPERARAFAAFALGLLGDQPFLADVASDGASWARLLWMRLARPRASSDLPVALLTALGHQRGAALPEAVLDGLRAMVVGRPVLGLRWTDVERSHALTALAQLAPGPALQDLLRVLGRRKESEDVLRAAALAVGAHAAAWNDDQRVLALPALRRALDGASDPWTRGLLRLAEGRLLAADAEAGAGLLAVSSAPRGLLAATESVPGVERGYAVLALALAAQPGFARGDPPAWALRARDLLLEGLERDSSPDDLRAAYAVALGLLGAQGAAPALITHVGDRAVGPQTRGHGAVALGQLRAGGAEALRALVLALSERRDEALRAQAALALSWLSSKDALGLLLRQIGDPEASEHVLAQSAVALGRLGDLGAGPALAELARDARHGETGRALAVVALGLILDPEPRSSLLRLAADANYPARTASLQELLTIL